MKGYFLNCGESVPTKPVVITCGRRIVALSNVLSIWSTGSTLRVLYATPHAPWHECEYFKWPWSLDVGAAEEPIW